MGIIVGAPKRQTGDTQIFLWATDWLILQGPSAPIFEGDPLVLRCRAWQDWPLTQVTFYRDGSALGPPGPNREFSIAVVHKADSGHYHCSGIFKSPGPGSPETAPTVAITVQGEEEKAVWLWLNQVRWVGSPKLSFFGLEVEKSLKP